MRELCSQVRSAYGSGVEGHSLVGLLLTALTAPRLGPARGIGKVEFLAFHFGKLGVLFAGQHGQGFNLFFFPQRL